MKIKSIFKNSIVVLMMAAMAGAVSCTKDNGGQPGPEPDPDPDPDPQTPEYSLFIGNCDSKHDPDGGLGTGGTSTFLAVTKLTAEQLSQYGSKNIVALRLGVAAESTGCKAFIRESLDGSNLVEADFEYNPYDWSYAAFDEAFEIPQGKELYIGYEITSSGYAVGVNGSGRSEDQIAVGGEWTTLSSVTSGHLEIQAVVTGGDYSECTPKHDLFLAGIDAQYNISTGASKEYYAYITNQGMAVAKSIKVEGSYNGESFSKECTDINIPAGANAKVLLGTFTAPSTTGEITIKATVTDMVDQDEVSNNNSKTVKQLVSLGGYERNMLLIEQFTGQACPNCPAGAKSLSAAIAGMTNPDKVCWVAHHSGYYPDDFTLDEDKEIASFFGVQAAPMSMINRTNQEVGGKTTLVFHPGYITTDMLNSLVSMETGASIDMTHTYNEGTRELEVTVSGESAESNIKVTVLVMQSGMIAQQSGGGDSYEHNFVPRAYLTPAMGKEVTVAADKKYSDSFTITLPEKVGNFDFSAADAEVVAFVSVNGSSRTASPALNAVKKPLVAGAASKTAGSSFFNSGRLSKSPAAEMMQF